MLNFIFGKIYRYGTVGILVAIALIQAGIFLTYVLARHYVFKRPMKGSYALPVEVSSDEKPMQNERKSYQSYSHLQGAGSQSHDRRAHPGL